MSNHYGTTATCRVSIMHEKFRVIAARISLIAGAPLSFSIALSLVLVWAVSGPFFHFSNTWQLIVNTGTTIVTFLMVFLIQNAQNRDAVAVQLKLDELIRSVQGARLGMINIDQLSDDDLTRLRAQFQSLGDEDGGCDELEADISTEEKLKVNVRTRFDSTGKLASQEVDREETRQRTATVRTDDDDHDEAAKPDKSGGPAVRRSGVWSGLGCGGAGRCKRACPIEPP